jgi:hypothetical protein
VIGKLICEEIAVDFIYVHKNEVCAGVVGFLRDVLHGVIEDVRKLKWLGSW